MCLRSLWLQTDAGKVAVSSGGSAAAWRRLWGGTHGRRFLKITYWAGSNVNFRNLKAILPCNALAIMLKFRNYW